MSARSEPSAVLAPQRLVGDRIVPLLRGALALVLALVITFTPDHSEGFGAIVFGVFALTTGVVQLLGAVRERRAGRPTGMIPALGLVALAAGVAVFLLPPPAFVAGVSAWALLTGVLELTGGVLARRRGRPGRDAIVAGALALLLAIVLLVVPPDYLQPWQVVGDEGIEATGAVTADIMTVGILGAWAVIHGVLLVIAALTPRTPERAA